MRSSDFVITRMITDRIGLHSVLLSLLSFLSRVVEKCVAKQLIDYLDANNLNVIYQSAYRKFHSTETKLHEPQASAI